MRYLLDVNVLLALALVDHEFHARVTRWSKPAPREAKTQACTCSITELGVIRILGQTVYGRTMDEAKVFLKNVKAIPDLDFTFLPDNLSALNLPAWVAKSGQVTDGHLQTLAARHGAQLATLDRGIPGAFLIPG